MRAVVLGVNDGVISVSSIMLGVTSAHASHSSILLSRIAGLTTGAMSMAAGEYVSVHSQADTELPNVQGKNQNWLLTLTRARGTHANLCTPKPRP